jgi:ribose transport system ATP-binding protein
VSDLTRPQRPGEYALRIRGLRKRYGEVEVLRGVDLDVRAGEVHALLGPNGAGKSTLLGCLSGAVVPDEGTLVIGGREVQGLSPASALAAGVATIYQHFQLIGPLSIADNVFLGSEIRTSSGRISKPAQNRRTAQLLGQLGSDLSPTRTVTTLSSGEKQLVEIARALRHPKRVLILDEPTSALSDRESRLLIELVRRLASSGMALIYVTHLFNEVGEVADVVTVLRDGQRRWTRAAAQVSQRDLVHAIAPQAEFERSARTVQSEVVAELEDYRGSWMGPVTVDVRAGEIVGVFGLMGSGRTDLLESMAGVRRGNGRFVVGGAIAPAGSIKAARRSGVALVPADRKGEALFPTMSALENMLLPHLRPEKRMFRHKRKERSSFHRMAREVGVVPIAERLEIDAFSGGNAQKLVIARWLLEERLRLLLVDELTQGVDVGARGDLYRLMREYVGGPRRGIVFATSDPEEAVHLSDRIIVLERGRVVGVVPGTVSAGELLALAHGGNGEQLEGRDRAGTYR